jgi:RNA polymerase sigma-70 factor (ECF subfamily)
MSYYDGLYQKHATGLLRLCYYYLGDREQAADAVQETYARLWEQRRKLARHVAPEAFAMQTLKNHCVDLLRQRHPTEPLDSLAETSDDDARREAELLEERAATLDRLMERLPEVQRRAIHMKYIQQLSHEEMQRELDMSSANVYTTLSRAISTLKKLNTKH